MREFVPSTEYQSEPSDMRESFRDVSAAGAILDRLLHHAKIIPINGRSYRLQPKA